MKVQTDAPLSTHSIRSKILKLTGRFITLAIIFTIIPLLCHPSLWMYSMNKLSKSLYSSSSYNFSDEPIQPPALSENRSRPSHYSDLNSSLIIQKNEKGASINNMAQEFLASSDDEECDLFSGEWVPNPSGPYYTNDTCWAIQEHQNCMKYGRPDSGFMKWRWKPNGCELPVLDPSEFLEYMRGKSVAFVGDSVARNHMQSLICLLSRVTYPIDISNTTNESFKRWEYRDYNFNISIFWSPYLVRTRRTDPNDITRPFNLYLDEFDESWTTQIWEFDYVIISAGHWFFRPTFRAINTLKDYRGVTFLRTFVPSHFENGLWDKGGHCTRTKPFKSGEIVLEDYSSEMYKIQVEEFKNAEKIGRGKGLKFRLFDMTNVMLLRPDGHPNKYGHWPVADNASVVNDCIHWCLPGPIDTWNDFLLKMVKTSFRPSNKGFGTP